MDRIRLKATATSITDQGFFEAVISTATPDREKDVVEPSAVLASMKSYGERRIPLAWAHSGDAANQIGYIEPSSAVVVGDEVHVKGWIDQSVEAGAHAWRLVKLGTLGFSYGYLITAGAALKSGGRHITGLDIFEVTATPTPMNSGTRVVSFKDLPDEVPFDPEEIESVIPHLQKALSRLSEAELPDAERDRLAHKAQRMLDAAEEPPHTAEEAADAADPLRARADALAFAHARRGEGSMRRRPEPKPQQKAQHSHDELREICREQMLTALAGDVST